MNDDVSKPIPRTPRACGGACGAAGSLGYLRRLLGRTRTLDSHASRLRRKLNRGGEAGYVLNVWGVGYRLTALS